MGSNAIRFLAAEFRSPTQYVTLASERVPVRLGHGAYLSGRLDSAAMDAALAALAGFAARMDEHGVSTCRAVATSAVRESRNGRQFVQRVAKQTGIEIEVIIRELKAENSGIKRMYADLALECNSHAVMWLIQFLSSSLDDLCVATYWRIRQHNEKPYERRMTGHLRRPATYYR